jgi:hypothetical protein
MNIKPRTAFITIGAVIGLIILGQATKHDQPTYAQQVAAMTPAEQKKEATFQRPQIQRLRMRSPMLLLTQRQHQQFSTQSVRTRHTHQAEPQ